MKVVKLSYYRDGNIKRTPVLVTSEPNKNGLVSFTVLDKDGEPMKYVSGTCRISDIENGVNIWSDWPAKFLKSKCDE